MYATVDKSRQKPKADVVKDDVTKKQNGIYLLNQSIYQSIYLSIYHDMPVFKLKKTHAPVGWRSLFSINKDVTHAGHYKGMEQEQ